ncbi:MAG: hypothetical protein WCI73_07665 [Phycisphaerae bacterium]
MTQPSRHSTPRVSFGQSLARRDQLLALAAMVLCLVGVFLLQPELTRQRIGTRDQQDQTKIIEAGIVPPPPAAMRQLAAEFPRLTLGGFRGLLVPFLWKQAEEDKNDRKWQDLNTTYNIIGKLEPYFVAVYVFNAWNQAYNLSAQWHGIDEKYDWVLEGLGHLYEGEEFNPKNPDILLEIAQMYFLKLGGSFERITYRQMWRDGIAHQYLLEQESQTDQKVMERHKRVRRFILRKQFDTELLEDPRNPSKVGYGIRIRGLFQNKVTHEDEPLECRYGVSPFYFAYKEYKRCLAAGMPSTTGIQIVHAFPAMSLRLWCRDDSYFAQSKIKEMFWKNTDGVPVAETIPDFDRRVLEIRDCFRNVQKVAPLAVEEFEKHLAVFPGNRSTHGKHILETQFVAQVAEAEKEMFEGLVNYYVGENRSPRLMTSEARRHLIACLPKYQRAIDGIQNYLDRIYPITNGRPQPDRADYAKFQQAMQERMEGVRTMLGAAEADGPKAQYDFSFLKSDTIER